jgi:CRP/FNR family transcriptional regulator, dissimilatory nitrate respiration regulator
MKSELRIESAAGVSRAELRGAVRDHALFAALDDDAFEQVLRSSRLVYLRPGEFLFQRGDAATRFFVMLSGGVNLVLQSRTGDEKVVETLVPGQSFAEALMFEARPAYPTVAVATAHATVLSVPTEAYRPVLAASASTCMQLLGDLSRRMHALVREVEAHSLTDARTRIVRHVLDLAGQTLGPPRAPLELTLTEPKQRIAARLGIAPETLSRTLRSLNDSGLMAVSGRTIRIHDLERLRAAA